MDILSMLLGWLTPASLGGAVVWLFSRNVRRARTSKEAHDAYKAMYDDVRETLMELQNENHTLYTAVARLERAITRTASCRYFPSCPVAVELRRQKGGNGKPHTKPLGQYAQRAQGTNLRTGSDESGGGNDADDPPP